LTIRSDRDDTLVAERVAANGTIERIQFRGSSGERMFSCSYLPASSPRGAVLICPSVHGEFTRNYRRDVLLARRLASDGFAVERFHYRGTGNSDGEGREVTFDTMREDALGSLEHVSASCGKEVGFLIGTRWGALVAASVASSHPGLGLVLWDPFVDTSAFFRHAFRARLIQELKSGVERPPTGEELTRRLRMGESVDVVGHMLDVGLYESSLGRTLEGELGLGPRSILLLQIGPLTDVKPDLVRLTDRCKAAGLHVDVEIVRGKETWWLVDDRWEDEAGSSMTMKLLETTAAWIAAHSAGGRAS
jgi:alpha/beta superfamily hydrolase